MIVALLVSYCLCLGVALFSAASVTPTGSGEPVIVM